MSSLRPSGTGRKRVAITGAASGLGRSLAIEYAREGWFVALSDVRDEEGLETLRLIKSFSSESFYSHVDVRNVSDLLEWKEAIVGRWGALDVLINNAGVATHGSIDKGALEDWDWVIDINLMGVVRGCHIFVGLFKKQGFGHLVNMASMAGLIHSPNMDSYNVTKASVVALSETLRVELLPFQIGVTVVCPGFFPTNLAESMRSPNPNIKTRIKELCAKSKVDADTVAQIIYKSVLNKKFYVLTHPNMVRIWFLKRYLPSLYFLYMKKLVQKQRKFLSRQDPDHGHGQEDEVEKRIEA